MPIPIEERCNGRVFDNFAHRTVYCSRRAIIGGYCKQHHPDAVQKRLEESERRYQAKQENSIYAHFDRARQRIAELEAEVARLKAELERRNAPEGEV